MNSFSVLLSVYYKENPSYLVQALDSVFSQTVRASQVVLVKDGILTPELDDVISDFQRRYPELETVPLPHNSGLGKALDEGLKFCRYDIVARMDTDDISKPERFSKQISYLNEHPEVDVLGAWIEEFSDSPDSIRSVRRVPESNEQIYAFGKKRCPLNHPVVMFRKKAVDAVGGYQHFPLFEDYHLWVRMMLNGSHLHNLQESLLYMRNNSDLFKRRGGWSYMKKELKFERYLLDTGYIGFPCYLMNIGIRSITRMIPNGMRSKVYKMIRK